MPKSLPWPPRSLKFMTPSFAAPLSCSCWPDVLPFLGTSRHTLALGASNCILLCPECFPPATLEVHPWSLFKCHSLSEASVGTVSTLAVPSQGWLPLFFFSFVWVWLAPFCPLHTYFSCLVFCLVPWWERDLCPLVHCICPVPSAWHAVGRQAGMWKLLNEWMDVNGWDHSWRATACRLRLLPPGASAY